MYDEKRRNGELAAARDDGRAEGLAEGITKGHADAQAEIARKMKTAGVAVEQIIQFTGLDRETVESL